MIALFVVALHSMVTLLVVVLPTHMVALHCNVALNCRVALHAQFVPNV